MNEQPKPVHGTSKPKIFAGIELGHDARAHVHGFARLLEESGFAARYEAPEKYHLTLAFLGWIDASLLVPVQTQLRAAAARCAPFSLAIDRIGAFPDERRPRVLWAGCSRPPSGFNELCAVTRDLLGSLGFGFEDPGVAHITLARVKRPQAPMPVLPAPEPVEIKVGALTLFESVPEKETTRYVRIVSIPLGV